MAKSSEPVADEASGIWISGDDAQASGGKFLGTQGRIQKESGAVSVVIPAPGTYQFFVRYRTSKGHPSGFITLVRDSYGEALATGRMDWLPRIPTTRPYLSPERTDPADPSGYVWEKFEITFERPLEVFVSFVPVDGVSKAPPQIDCIVVSDDAGFNPEQTNWKTSDPPAKKGDAKPPEGMREGTPLPMHTAFFTGKDNLHDQFRISLSVGGSIGTDAVFDDQARLVQMGVTEAVGYSRGKPEFGLIARGRGLSNAARELRRKIPAPEGRFVNADGDVGQSFSFSYQPYVDGYMEEFVDLTKKLASDPTIKAIGVAPEFGGFLDYSPWSRERFHGWLKERYGSVDKLNAAWKTDFPSFDKIPLPGSFADGKALWFDFRKFCGLEYVRFIGKKTAAIRKYAPAKGIYMQPGGSHMFNARTMVRSPFDFEDLVEVALNDVDNIGWDVYSGEDQIACQIDFMRSIGKDRDLFNEEWNTHTHDPRIAVRTYWTMVGKGMKGVTTVRGFPILRSRPIWNLFDAENRPRPKMGALADVWHETHRLSQFLVPARHKNFVKPVALYYSRMDLSLPQPALAAYDVSVNSPYRIYSVLRGLGYPVRWITPRQIEAGELGEVAAVVMAGVEHVPAAAAEKLAAWVKGGGCIVGDQWVGAYNEYGFSQLTMADVFGIRAKQKKSVDAADAKLAFQESTMSEYGDLTPLEVSADALASNIAEIFDQWDATHPLARKLGPWRLTGYGNYPVECISGDVLGMNIRDGGPGVVLNPFGSGHALYVGAMLGSLYDASPTSFEWDTMREGTALFHLLDEFFAFCGVRPFSSTGLPERLALKLRIESPLIDSKGNVVVAMESLNDTELPEFPVSLHWPKGSPNPKMALVAANGSRQIEKIAFAVKDETLEFRMPSFDSSATLLLLTDSDPIVSLDFSGAERGDAGLLQVNPRSRLAVKATVWNPSPRELPAGDVRLYLPPGWFDDHNEVSIDPIAAYGSREVSFQVAPPSLCRQLNLRPIAVRYEGKAVSSAPATEMVWWDEAR